MPRLRLEPILIFLAFFAPGVLSAQRQIFHQYGSSDGLTNLNVRCLLQDRTGYLWVGTDNGLFRYDGGKFRAFGHSDGLSNTEVISLAESPAGALWVGTNDGVAVLSGEHFQPLEIGQQGATHHIGFDSAGNVYLEHDSGIIRGVAGNSAPYRFQLVVTGAVSGLFVKGSEVLFGKDGGFWRLNGNNAERFSGSFGLPKDRWASVAQDSLGNKWIRSRTHLYELPRGQTRFLDRSEGIPNAVEATIYPDHHGRVFVPTVSGIVVLWGKTSALIDALHGLPADPSGPILIDREDLLWLGTDGGGLIRRLGHGEWLAWTEADGLLRNSVWAIQIDHSGNVWVGTNGGLSIFNKDGELWHSFTHRNGLASDRVLSIAQSPSGDFYVGNDVAGISQFSAAGVLLHTYKAESGYHAERVSSMAFDQQGRLWAVGVGGCFRSRNAAGSGRLSFEQMNIPGMPSHTFFRDVVVDGSGLIWIASSRGLAVFNGSQWRLIRAQDGLKSSDLGVVAQAQGAIWVAYRDALGMTRIQSPGNQLTHFSMRDGLTSDQIYGIESDHKGQIWVSTDMGLDVLSGGRWKHYGSEDGLIWNDTDSLALNIDSADNVWIGTSGGLSKFAQPEFPVEEQPPPLVLTSITGTSKQWLASDNPTLDYSARALSIQYAALTYESLSTLRFRYRLVGSDQSWTETNERGVHFAALPPGHYVFEVTAVGPNGSWNPNPARFAFSIRSPWWLSWWFLSSVTLLTLLIGSVLVRLRIRILEAQKKALEKQVADRTAELVASHRQLEEIAYCDVLTSMPNRRMFVEEFRKRLASPESAEPFVLLLIDLDFFKQVNDIFGHDAGDAVLVETAARIKSQVRHSDCVARLGGDEFAVLLSSVREAVGAETFCKRLLEAVAAPIQYKESTLRIGCSIGIARYPAEGDSQDSLYKSADKALYEAKQTGRNSFSWHCPERGQTVPASVN
ncbi:MAG: diguanylate cyclase [Terracidiphilus sp.]